MHDPMNVRFVDLSHKYGIYCNAQIRAHKLQ